MSSLPRHSDLPPVIMPLVKLDLLALELTRWPRELVLDLLEALTTSKLGCTMPTLVDARNSGLHG